MGYVICPNGATVQTDKLDRSLPYEYLVRDAKDEKWSAPYRAKCIIIIGDIGVHGGVTKDFVPYLHKLASEADSELLKQAAIHTLKKISANFMR